jgi:hypothetical protein
MRAERHSGDAATVCHLAQRTRRETGARRFRFGVVGQVVWLLVATGLLAGCGEADSGDDSQQSSVASTPASAAPGPLLVRELPGLLLDRDAINRVMGATGMELKDKEWSRMSRWNTTAGDCAATWIGAWGPVYEGSGWMGLRGNTFSEPEDAWSHRVWQAVVAFPFAADAKEFYTKQVASWKTCDGRRIDERDVDKPGEPNEWTVGQASDAGGMLTVVDEEVDNPGWLCQRALTARNNVVVDIRACGRDLKTEAGQVATEIAAKVPNR